MNTLLDDVKNMGSVLCRDDIPNSIVDMLVERGVPFDWSVFGADRDLIDDSLLRSLVVKIDNFDFEPRTYVDPNTFESVEAVTNTVDGYIFRGIEQDQVFKVWQVLGIKSVVNTKHRS